MQIVFQAKKFGYTEHSYCRSPSSWESLFTAFSKRLYSMNSYFKCFLGRKWDQLERHSRQRLLIFVLRCTVKLVWSHLGGQCLRTSCCSIIGRRDHRLTPLVGGTLSTMACGCPTTSNDCPCYTFWRWQVLGVLFCHKTLWLQEKTWNLAIVLGATQNSGVLGRSGHRQDISQGSWFLNVVKPRGD